MSSKGVFLLRNSFWDLFMPFGLENPGPWTGDSAVSPGTLANAVTGRCCRNWTVPPRAEGETQRSSLWNKPWEPPCLQAVQICGEATAASGKAVQICGEATAASGKAVQIRGEATAASGKAVQIRGEATAASGKAVQIRGEAIAASGKAVQIRGEAIAASGKAVQIRGEAIAASGKGAVCCPCPHPFPIQGKVTAQEREAGARLRY